METILIIEDDPEIQENYNELLHFQGYCTVNAYNGKDGIDKLEKYNPDLVICDLDLGGGLNGRDVILYMKRKKIKTPVIVVSGKSGMESDPEIEMCSNIYRFFIKPAPLSELSKAIQKILGTAGKTQISKSAAVPNDPRIGQKVAGCTIESILAEGGCGRIYKGNKFGKTVAIKFLKEDALYDQEELARFSREAQILATLKHPNIIELIDSGKTKEGHMFLIMSYFEGASVESILRDERKFFPEEAIEIVCQVTEGMAAAHAVNLIHRDIKPSNILYNRAERMVKIIDFGTARKQEADQRVTKTGYVVGTPFYMSPEQCQGGRALDIRCDIYSLGATFYHMLTGNPPFNRPTAVAAMIAHLFDALVWPDASSQIPMTLKSVVEKMMEKSAEKRYKTMEEISYELKNIRFSL